MCESRGLCVYDKARHRKRHRHRGRARGHEVREAFLPVRRDRLRDLKHHAAPVPSALARLCVPVLQTSPQFQLAGTVILHWLSPGLQHARPRTAAVAPPPLQTVLQYEDVTLPNPDRPPWLPAPLSRVDAAKLVQGHLLRQLGVDVKVIQTPLSIFCMENH
jgi:hypothetical protein